MSVWSAAIGMELGFESLGITGRRVRFYCFHCLAKHDPRGEAAVWRTSHASECMDCVDHDGEIFVAIFFDVPPPIELDDIYEIRTALTSAAATNGGGS